MSEMWTPEQAEKINKTWIKPSADYSQPLNDLLSEKITPEEFKKQYVGEFEQDPLLEEAVEFLRTATFKQVAQARRDGLLSVDLHREARRILKRSGR